MPAYPKSGDGQNKRSKALPSKDGTARSTEPKGFKKPTPKPRRIAHDVVRDAPAVSVFEPSVAELDDAAVNATIDPEFVEPRRPATAALFARAVDLTDLVEKRAKTAAAPEGPMSPHDWHVAVALDHNGRCALSDLESPHWDHDDWECHHVIEKKLLKQRGLQGWIWDRRIGAYLTKTVHAWFDDASDRCVPREVLHPCVWEALAEMDEQLGTSWATEWVLERYPVVGPERLADLKALARGEEGL